ncbi:hypothetical protein M0804_009082 [Polistes exclamans]|nr:hypothetical protein M0804_009082 [Polistes exclamans]
MQSSRGSYLLETLRVYTGSVLRGLIVRTEIVWWWRMAENLAERKGAEANAQLQPSGTVCLAQHAAAGRLRPMVRGFAPKMLEEIKKEFLLNL